MKKISCPIALYPYFHIFLTLFPYFLISLLFLTSCEKEISVDLPKVEPKLVVEGFIEQGLPPFIKLTKSAGFFEPADSASLSKIIVKDAIIKFSDGTRTVTLNYFQPVDSILNFGFYTTFDFSMFGKVSSTYNIEISWNGKNYTSSTFIPQPVALDSIWFQPDANDSLSFIWAALTDPGGVKNSYRWFTQRISEDPDLNKDPYPIPASFSAFDDQFFDGKPVDFFYERGRLPNSEVEGETNAERIRFKRGDTVMVRFCTIPEDVFEFLRAYESETANSGNPFAAPSSIPSNITGGALGYWGGYGASYDTVIFH